MHLCRYQIRKNKRAIGAQKNIGPAGVTLVIIRQDLITKPSDPKLVAPLMLDYPTFANSQSLYNTPPTFSIYVSGLVFDWLASIGGISKIEALNDQKSKRVYEALKASRGFYQCPVHPDFQSRMNIPFRIYNPKTKVPDPLLETQFLQKALARGLCELGGHRSVGGIRASLYNAMPLEGVEALVEFLQDFYKEISS